MDFRMVSAGIPHTVLHGHEDSDVPPFWLLLYEASTLTVTYQTYMSVGSRSKSAMVADKALRFGACGTSKAKKGG